ncbi:phage holin family protein [Priestia sp. FSL W8-0001]|uniref:phage holin family protein n=1 Tax=Bacillaceae TaxID=186817 RepID=UPI0023569DB5|nr:phage holin family protein [Bacillus weihaiensis]
MKFSADIFDLRLLINPSFSFAGIAGGSIGIVLNALYGNSQVNMYIALLLILVVAFDWLGAIGAALKDGSYSSDYGIRGVVRTTVILMLPLVGRLMDTIIGTPVVIADVPISGFYLFISSGLIYHSWMSMTANFARAGYDKWIPEWMLKAVASEINAKITRSEGRKEAILGNQVQIPPTVEIPPVAPVETLKNDSETK